MKAMVLGAVRRPLEERELPVPAPGPGQLLIQVRACGVCRTDLHILDGELPDPKLPLVLGHEIVGVVERAGRGACEARGARRFSAGDRVGVPWLGWTCGKCPPCRAGRENLCDAARFTGYQLDGGYAQYAVADARFVFPIPPGYSDAEAAPLLCAGLIGHRALSMAPGERLGLFGFGAAAHLVAQVACRQGRKVFAFTRPGDARGQAFARSLGARWAGDSAARPPEELDAAILFAPLGALVPAALRCLAKGGVLVCAGIHMSEIPAFPYSLLWGERCVRSVANLTRRDAEEFLALAAKVPLRVHARPFKLLSANEALRSLRDGRVRGAAVLLPQDAGKARGK